MSGAAGYVSELIGVNYGILFGNYSYGDVLGQGIMGVPFIITLNWIIILTGSISLSEMIFKNKILIVTASSVISVILDYIMEPVAVFFGYWAWEDNYIPLTNYLTWGVLILIFSIIFQFLKFSYKTRLPASLFVIQLIYFLIFRITIYLKILN